MLVKTGRSVTVGFQFSVIEIISLFQQPAQWAPHVPREFSCEWDISLGIESQLFDPFELAFKAARCTRNEVFDRITLCFSYHSPDRTSIGFESAGTECFFSGSKIRAQAHIPCQRNNTE
jgi:hypothetical protein